MELVSSLLLLARLSTSDSYSNRSDVNASISPRITIDRKAVTTAFTAAELIENNKRSVTTGSWQFLMWNYVKKDKMSLTKAYLKKRLLEYSKHNMGKEVKGRVYGLVYPMVI